MELELGLKITRTREDVSSSVDFGFSKDPFGPLVLSRETDSRFIIIIHIKGFKKEGIEIEINKEGNRITIRGRKPVEEIVLIRWMAWRKEVEFRTFRKVFLIPDIVDLDKIKARFDDDDATLTITMPKIVKGISGFKLEEEEEEIVDFGDVSETQNKEEVEEGNVGREESDEDSEIQREEEFGEMMEEKETESQVFEGEEKGFSGDLDEEETQIEDDDLEKIQQVDEQDKILEFAGEETVGRQEWADSNTQTEDSSLKKLPDITEQENNQEVMEKQVETKSEGTESKAVEEIEEQEPDEQSEGGATDKKTTSDDGDGLSKVQGIEETERHSEERKIQDMVEGKGEEEKTKIVKKKSKVQGIEEPERHNEENKIQEMVEEKTGGQEKKEIETMVIKNKDGEEECDRKMGEGFTPNIERTQVVAEDDTAETETKAEEFESEKPEADEVDKKHELVEKKEEEEENASVRRKSEDGSLIKLQENEEQHSKGRKRQDEQKNIKDLVEEKTPDAETITANGQRDLANSNTESEDSSLRKLPDITEQEDNQEVMDKQVSQVETKSDANGSRAVEEIEEQESDALDRTNKSREMEKKTTDGDDDGLSKVQGIEEPERHNGESKTQEIVDEETGGQENKNTVTMDAKEEFDRKMGEGFTPNVEKTRVVGEDDIAETETKAEEFEYEKPEADEVDNKYELVEKKEEEEENANVRRKSENRSLTKLPENEEQHSKGTKRQDKQENIKELMEEKTPKAETNAANDVPKPVQKIEAPEVDMFGKTDVEGKEEKEKKKSVKMEIENGDAKEEVDAKMGVPNIVETETKPAESESEKLEADEVGKIHELVEMKREKEEETNAKVGTQSEDVSLTKAQDIEEQQSQRHKRHDKHEKIKELVEVKNPEAETNIGNDTPKKFQEKYEGKQKMKEIFQEETKKQSEEHKEKMVETGKQINDAGSKKSQEIIRQQEVDESERYEKESKPQESVKSIPNDEEKEISETETKEQESYRPKILEEPEKVQELAEEKTDFLKNGKVKEEEEIAEKKTELSDDDISRKVGDNQLRNSDAKEGVDAEMVEGFTPNIAETERIAEEFEPHKLEPDEVDDTHELVEKQEGEEDNAKVRRQSEDKSFKELQENEKQHSKGQKRQEKTAETETKIPKPVQETAVPEVDTLGKTGNEGKEGKEKKKSVTKEIKNGYPKEEVDAKNGKGFAPNIAETETRPEEFEPQKLEQDEVDEIHQLVEKKKEEEDNAKVRTQSEDSSLVKKLQETEEQQFQRQKRHNKQEKVKELLQEKTPAAETNIANQIPKPVQVIEEPEVDTLETCGEKEISETEAKEQDSYRPKTHGELEKIQKLAEEKTDFLKNGKVKEEEEISEKKTEFGDDDDDDHNSRNVGNIEQRDSDAKEEVYAGVGKGFTPNIAETETESAEFESDKVKADEVDNTHELVEKKKKKEEEEENDKVRKQSEDTSLKRLQEQNFQGPNRHNKQEKIKELVEEKPVAETNIANESSKPVQETEKPEVDTLEKCVDREFSEMETKEQESFRPKILEGEDKIQELDEEKNASRKVEGEEENAEKKTELGEDDMSRKVRDIEQRGSDATKGQEEKEKSQELVLEEKVSDGGKGIVTEAIKENDESRKVQETGEQHPDEEDKRGNQFQKLIRGETSGYGEVEDVENEKKTTEAEKRVRDSEREAQEIVRADSDVSGKYGKGDTFQELQENRTTYQNEQEEDKESEADRPQKITGAIEQELVYLNSQVDQDNVEDGEETRDPVDDKTNDCKEEESATKTDDVVRKVEGIKEQELFEPKRDHVCKINEMVEEIMAESEIEAEFGGLSKVHGTEEQELHEPNIHKERDKTKIKGREEPSVQEKEDEENEKIVESMTITEKEISTNAEEIREDRPDEPESHEKQYKVQEPVEAGHNGHKEEQKDEKLTVKAKGETEEDSSEKVQESDGMKRSIVQDKNQETKEKEITRAMKEKEIVETRTQIEDGSWRKVQDDEDPELTKPYKRQEDKIQDPLETGISDYRKKVKKEDGNDTLSSQETGKPNLDEFEKFSEQRNVPKFVDEERMENIAKPGGGLEDDDSAKFHEFEERKSDEDWIREEREKMKDLVKEEAIDPKEKHTGEAGHNDHKEEQQEEMVIAKAELKAKEDSSEKFQEIENQKSDELQRSVVRDKMQETEEKDKTRAMEENEIVEGRTKNKDGSLRKVREGEEDPELGRYKTYEEEDRSPELLEADTSDHREKSKKQVGDDILRSQETGKLDLGELERQRKQRKIHQPVQDEKGEGTMENISEPRGKMEGDSSGKFHESQKQKSYEDWRQEEGEEIKDLVKEEATDLKDKHTGGKEEHEEERYHKVPQAKTKAEDEVNKKVGDNKKEEETGDQGDERTGEAAVVVANNEKDSSKELHSREGEELKEPDEHKEHDEIPETSDPKVKESDGERVSEKETKEQEAHVQQLEGKPENFKDNDVEARRGKKGKQGKTVEAKSDEIEKRGTSNHEVELVTEDDSLRKGQEFLENESSNVSKGRPVEQEKPVAETETKADKSRKHETQELVESEENEELKKIRKPMEERTNAPEKEKGKEGTEKIAEEMQGKIDIKMKDQDTKRQEPYELLEDEEHGKIPEPIVEGTKRQRQEEKRMADGETEEMKRKSEDISSIKFEKIKAEESDGLEKHRKLSAIQENQSLEEKIPEPGQEEEEVNEGGEYKAVLKKKSMEDSSHSKDVEENGSDQRERYAEEEKIQEPMVEEEGKEEYDIREGEKNETEKRTPQVESKANDDSSKKNEKEKRLPQVESKANDDISKKNEKEKRTPKVESKANDDSSKKNEKEKRIPQVESKANDDSLKKNEKEKRTPQVESKANDDSSKKNEKEKRTPQVESKANDDSLKNNEGGRLRRQKQNEDHQELVEIEKSDQRKEEKEEKIVGKGATTDHEYKIHEHEEGKSGSLTKEEASNDKEENRGNRAGAERKIRDDGFEEEQLAIVVRHREQDKKQSFVGKDTNGEAKENKNHESKSREDSSRKTHENEQQESHQQKRHNEEQEKKIQGTNYCRNEEDGKEDKQIAEAEDQRKLKGIEEQGRIKELVEDKTHYCRETEFEDGSSKKTPEIDKEELTEPGRDEKRDEIEEPLDRETSEDDEEEELEVEVEDSEEDWEAEVIQEMDSDEDNDKIRKIRRIKLGFRLVGGSTLFMSLIVIVISFIRSKRKIRCYKF